MITLNETRLKNLLLKTAIDSEKILPEDKALEKNISSVYNMRWLGYENTLLDCGIHYENNMNIGFSVKGSNQVQRLTKRKKSLEKHHEYITNYGYYYVPKRPMIFERRINVNHNNFSMLPEEFGEKAINNMLTFKDNSLKNYNADECHSIVMLYCSWESKNYKFKDNYTGFAIMEDTHKIYENSVWEYMYDSRNAIKGYSAKLDGQTVYEYWGYNASSFNLHKVYPYENFKFMTSSIIRSTNDVIYHGEDLNNKLESFKITLHD